ncbi:hypothetical protein I7I53_02697 [Histoplasma capsulatum var. duboisii H88]|uniref:Uncharacterized protein n=1 Tax=Ajellomyces capsulatus (strain H88) TaxID=544711 RepID=A0A8A1LQU5_AJEC8|nr:hypothetical protein I7I53_02697 [Histoplasma capsulatum var. duboisii H88]
MSIPTSDRYMMIDMMIDLISYRYMFPGDIILSHPPLFSPPFFCFITGCSNSFFFVFNFLLSSKLYFCHCSY